MNKTEFINEINSKTGLTKKDCKLCLNAIIDVIKSALSQGGSVTLSNFGKFMDPLADKLLVMSALVSMVALKDLAAWVVIVILAREFTITGFRTLAMEANIVMAASWWGKVKTTVQMIMIPVVLLNLPFDFMVVVEPALIYLSVFFTIFSGADYIIKNKQVLLG